MSRPSWRDRLKNWFPLFAVRNLSALFSSQVLALITGLVYSVIVVRFLGAYRYGQLLIVMSAGDILVHVSYLKVSTPLTKLIRESIDRDAFADYRKYFTASLVWQTLSACLALFALGMGYAAEGILDWFEKNWFILILPYLASQILRKYRSVITDLFQAEQLYGNLSVMQVTSSSILDFLPLLFLPWGIPGILLGYLTAECLILAAHIMLWSPPVSPPKAYQPHLQWSYQSFVTLFNSSRDYYLAKFVDKNGGKVANLMIAWLAGAAGLSFYNIGQKFYKAFNPIFPTLKTYLFPRLIQKWNQRKDEFFYTFGKFLVSSWAVVLGAGVIMGLAVPYVLPWLYGQEFGPSVHVFYILLPGYLISLPPGNIFREVSFAANNVSFYRDIHSLSMGLYLVLILVLTWLWSFLGAAGAFTLRRMIVSGLILHWYWNLYRTHATAPREHQ